MRGSRALPRFAGSLVPFSQRDPDGDSGCRFISPSLTTLAVICHRSITTPRLLSSVGLSDHHYTSAHSLSCHPPYPDTVDMGQPRTAAAAVDVHPSRIRPPHPPAPCAAIADVSVIRVRVIVRVRRVQVPRGAVEEEAERRAPLPAEDPRLGVPVSTASQHMTQPPAACTQLADDASRMHEQQHSEEERWHRHADHHWPPMRRLSIDLPPLLPLLPSSSSPTSPLAAVRALLCCPQSLASSTPSASARSLVTAERLP